MLPVITTTGDVPGSTIDDSQHLSPSTIVGCVGFTVDVKGPGFLTGDVTWSVLNSANTVVAGAVIAGQNTEEATILFPNGTPIGTYTIKACLTSNLTDCSTSTIELTEAPPITVGLPNQPYVTGQTQFKTTYPYGAIVWAPAEVNSATGLATWTTPGIKNVSYTVGACVTTYQYQVYSNIVIANYTPGSCIYINSGEELQLDVSGGSGNYTYSISGQNNVTGKGLIQAGLYAGEYTLNIVDTGLGIVQNVPVCIGSQTQFCIAAEKTDCIENSENFDPCCEITVDAGESVKLKVPTFHMRINGSQKDVIYYEKSSGTFGDSGYLKSGSGITDARGNAISCDDNESLFEIVTSLDMADLANAPFGIGFSKVGTVGSGVNSIETAIVWYTRTGVRYVEVRKEGVYVAGTRFQVAQGDIVSGGFKNGIFVVYINNLLKSSLDSIICYGDQFLDVSIEQANKAIGGNLAGLTWTIITPGTPNEVGSINGDGIYSTPTTASFSLVQAEATVGNAKFRVNIRNIKPTPRFQRPQAFLAGKAVDVWVGPYIPGFNELIRLAKDGSPDALQNTYKGVSMIDLGTLEGSANFQLTRDFQDFENDLGDIYHTSITKESATLAATFLQIRDLAKMSMLLPDSILHGKQHGTTELSVGGGGCDIKELRVIMVIGNPQCEDEFDVLYLPRVQNKGNLGLEVGKKTNGKFEMTLTALPDYSRPTGKQLFSLLQIDACSSGECTI